mmetsp:Transcript_8906/g.20009  ORF Transcript_8906/g.20009 Transcript_8906/m.20009 type:complete len:450 (+) Transcript_8906:61-1410(+)
MAKDDQGKTNGLLVDIAALSSAVGSAQPMLPQKNDICGSHAENERECGPRRGRGAQKLLANHTMLVEVISASVESDSSQEVDAIDHHNRPRLRRKLILSALFDKYPQLVSLTKPLPCEVDLVDLYSCVHDVGMLQFLVHAWSKWEAMGPDWDEECCHPEWAKTDENKGIPPPMIPCHASFRRSSIERPSTNVMGAIGYYCTDNMTPIVGSLVCELQEDASIICSAVNHAFQGNTVVYAVTTHPGHHANRDNYGGYCYLNNAALCATLIQKRLSNKQFNSKSRIGIIDIDYHCGNGTADIFYNNPDVFFASIHCDPDIEYPFNAGYEDQNGEGDGKGTTLHVPLEAGATWDGAYKSALEKAMTAMMDFNIAGLVISIGLDTYLGDSVAMSKGGFKLSGNDYYELGHLMGEFLKGRNIPTVFVQEGGYKMDVVGQAAADVVGGFAIGASDD